MQRLCVEILNDQHGLNGKSARPFKSRSSVERYFQSSQDLVDLDVNPYQLTLAPCKRDAARQDLQHGCAQALMIMHVSGARFTDAHLRMRP